MRWRQRRWDHQQAAVAFTDPEPPAFDADDQEAETPAAECGATCEGNPMGELFANVSFWLVLIAVVFAVGPKLMSMLPAKASQPEPLISGVPAEIAAIRAKLVEAATWAFDKGHDAELALLQKIVKSMDNGSPGPEGGSTTEAPKQ